MIKPRNENSKEFVLEYDFEIGEYLKILGVSTVGGKDYETVKSTLRHLSDRSMWVEIYPGEETLLRWLSKVRIYKKSGIAKIKIDEDIAPFLFDLKNKFTSYNLINVLAMRSAYSIRLFELLKSYEYRHRIVFDLSELKKLLMAESESYNDYDAFKRKVLNVALQEINLLTDINVSFELRRERKKVVSIEFFIEQKDNRLTFESWIKASAKLNENNKTNI